MPESNPVAISPTTYQGTNGGGNRILTHALAIKQFGRDLTDMWVKRPDNLRQKCKLRTGIVGTEVSWDLLRPLVAHERGDPRTDVPLQSLEAQREWMKGKTYAIAEIVDLFQRTNIVYNELAEVTRAFTRALGEVEDQIVINAIDAGIPKNVGGMRDRLDNRGYCVTLPMWLSNFGRAEITNASGDGAPGNNDSGAKFKTSEHLYGQKNCQGTFIEALIHINKILTRNNVPMQDRTALMSPDVWELLMMEPRFQDYDVNNRKVLPAGMNPSYMGFNLMTIGQAEVQGLPTTDPTDIDRWTEFGATPYTKATLKAAGGLTGDPSKDVTDNEVHAVNNALEGKTKFQDVLIWAKECIGYGVWQGTISKTTYENAKMGWLTTAGFKAGAKTRQGLGTVRIQVAG